MKIEIEIPDEATPGRYGVYVLTDEGGEFLYIGHTSSLLVRMRQHKAIQPWWREVRGLEWNPCDGYQEARIAEKELIALYLPRYNDSDTVALPAPRSRWTKSPELPDWTVARLVEMREDEASSNVRRNTFARDKLDSYILSLRNAGWSLEVIGRGLSMTRERVRQRQVRATAPLKGASVPQVPVKVKPAPKVRPSIPAATLAEMRKLQVLARKVNGPTPLDHPNRVASVQFTEMIAEQHLAGVSIYRISQQLGVTPLAVRARLARHGYMEPVKGLHSNIPYGTPWSPGNKNACKAGHSLTDETNIQIVRSADGKTKRFCKACQARRSAEWRGRKKASA